MPFNVKRAKNRLRQIRKKHLINFYMKIRQIVQLYREGQVFLERNFGYVRMKTANDIEIKSLVLLRNSRIRNFRKEKPCFDSVLYRTSLC